MFPLRHTVIIIALTEALLVFQATLGTFGSVWPWMSGWMPNWVVPVVVYMGISTHISVPLGASCAFVFGYTLDALCGLPISLNTLVLVATFVMTRGAGLKFFLRGKLSEVGLVFVVALVNHFTVLALQVIFGPPPPFSADSVFQTVGMLLAPSLGTAMVAPLVFWMLRKTAGVQTSSAEHSI